MEKWKEEYLAKLPIMDNAELFSEYTYYSGGDDYDGCMTKRGEWIYTKVVEELNKRLVACGFFTDETKIDHT